MAAGKRYSAGRIFLQVVPSFKNLQNDIQREVNKANAPLAKQQEELGKKAEQARAKGAAAERKRSDAAELRDAQKQNDAKVRQFQRFTQMMVSERAKQSARDQAIEDRNAKRFVEREMEIGRNRAKAAEQAEAEKTRVQQAAERERQRLARKNLDLEIGDMRRAVQEQARVEAEAQRASDRQTAKDEAARSRVNRRRAADRLATMQREDRERRRLAGGGSGQMIRSAAKAASDVSYIKVDADSSPAERKLAALRERLARIHAEVGIDMPVEKAMAEIKMISRELDKLGRKSPDVTVRVNSRLARAELDLFERKVDQVDRKKIGAGLFSSTGADEGANAFRIFNWRVAGALLLVPLLSPVLASAAGAMGAIGTAAIGGAAGIGVMIAGFTGLQDAVTAMIAVQDNKVKDDNLSEKAMRNAAKGVRDSQQALDRAREQAARSAEDSARRVADARQRVSDVEASTAKSIRDALRSQQDAERNLANAQKDATKAQNDLRDARKQAQQDQQDLADKIKAGQLDERQSLIDLFNAQVAYNTAMADGGATNLEKEQVSINLERARMAIAGVRKENAALLDEQKNGNPKAAQAVADAQDRVVQANQRVADAQQNVADSAEKVRDARVNGAKDIADAQQGVKDALRDQARAAADSQLAIRDASERVKDSQAALREALIKTGEVGSASVDKLNTAMAKLGPEGREFAKFIFSLYRPLLDLRNLIQAGMLPPLQKEIQSLVSVYGPRFRDFVKTMAGAVGDVFTMFGEALKSPEMQVFFDTMAQYAPTFFKQFAAIGVDMMKVVAGIATAFAPFAKDFMDWVVKGADDLAKWATNLKDSQGFKDFIAYVKQEGPKVWQLVKDIAETLWNIGNGMSNNGFFDSITGFFHSLKDVDPNTLAQIVQGVLGLAIASQVSAGINSLAISIKFLATSAGGPWIVLLMAIGAAFVWMYNNNEDFRRGADFLLNWFKTVFWPRFTEGWSQLMGFFGYVGSQFMDGLHQMGDAFSWLWGYVKGYWNSVAKPIFDVIQKVITGDFVGAFQTATKAIGGIWASLVQLFRTPINFVIGTILNDGLFAGINSVLDFLGVSARIPKLDLVPDNSVEASGAGPLAFAGSRKKNKYAFASGGVMPGYTPGRDVHHFYSPTGGLLDLSGGEGIMRPEFTRAVGGERGIHALNAAARRGELPWQQFAIGGMVKPVNANPRFPWGSYPSGKTHRALDLPVPEGTPVVSPYAGTIIKDGWDSTGFGTHLRLAADNGTFWIFGHLMREMMNVGQHIAAGQLMAYSGNTGNSTGPHLHLEGRTSPYDPSSAFNFTNAFNGGTSVTPAAGAAAANLPWWADKPLSFIEGLVTSLTDKIPGKGILADMLRGFPHTIFGGARSFLSQFLGSNELDSATGGKLFWNGREVPNNGTQMFDNGGLIQPGATQILNMTGKPEPVFTADQWAPRGGAGGATPLIGSLTVPVHGTDLTPGDVAGEIMHTVRRVEHGGKYAGVAR